jgi:hypothetical protein
MGSFKYLPRRSTANIFFPFTVLVIAGHLVLLAIERHDQEIEVMDDSREIPRDHHSGVVMALTTVRLASNSWDLGIDPYA